MNAAALPRPVVLSPDSQWADLAFLLPQPCESLLDVGCGDGRILASCPHIPCRAGIDIDPATIERATKTFPDITFLVARAEHLPFPDATFDAIVTSVALPYTKIQDALSECARVLRRGGVLYASVHSLEFLRSVCWKAKPNFAGRLFRAYTLLNGLSFYLFGKVFRYPLKPSLCESFQTERGLTLALQKAGFNEVKNLNRRVPSFMAVKP